MIYDATLKKLFQRFPNRLFQQALGREVALKRMLPTEMITIENLHPDLLFESEDGELIHAEIHGYPMADFACRNLIYFALVLRDYGRAPAQVVFWIGPRDVGLTDGLDIEQQLRYRYVLIDVRQLDPGFLLDSPDVNECIFAILCKLNDARTIVSRILGRIAERPRIEQREAIAQLLVLSGLRGLKTVVKEAVKRMPLSIDIHENEFLEEIYQEGEAKGRLQATRELLADQLLLKFGPLSPEVEQRIASADLDQLKRWSQRLLSAPTLEGLFEGR